MNLQLTLKNIRGIQDFVIDLPIEKGLFAITGENGIGKSTVFCALSKIVYRAALQKLFKNDGNSASIVQFSYDNKVNTWSKPLGWQRNDSGHDEIFFDGSYEGSIIFGNRFSDAKTTSLSKTNKIKREDLTEADIFIKENLGLILKKNKNFYGNLKCIKSKQLAIDYKFSGMPYVFENNGNSVHHLLMSSGEFLLIGLLHFIKSRIDHKNKKGVTSISIILIDELELALHPSAQERLAVFLNKLCSDYNFCIYFATHSIQIINQVRPEKIFYLENSFESSISVINPCYPAYATRSIYTADGFDFVILVEDILAKHIVEKILRKRSLHASKLIKVLPCGGWEKTLELHDDFVTYNLVGVNCKLLSILDGDIQVECNRKYPRNTSIGTLPKRFLPIKSLEKHIRENLIINVDINFAKKLGDEFFRVRPLVDIVADYSSRTSKDNDGKILFMVLARCAAEQGFTDEIFKKEMCNFISDYEDLTRLEDAIIQFIGEFTPAIKC